jgi:hypothetical protein
MELERIKRLEQELWRLREVRDFPSAQLADVNSYINKNKYKGMFVWDSTNNVPKWASGPAPSDPWVEFLTEAPAPVAVGPEYIVSQGLGNATFIQSYYTNGPSSTFTLDVAADVEYYVEGTAFWSWNGTAGGQEVEVEFEMRAQIGSSTLWEAVMLHGRTTADQTSLYSSAHVSKRFVQLNKAAGTYTVQYQGKYALISPTGNAFARLYTPSVGVIIHR